MIRQWAFMKRFWFIRLLRSAKSSAYACVVWAGTLRKVA
jgi:hypothetical protein